MPEHLTPRPPTDTECRMRKLAYAFVAQKRLDWREILVNQFVRALQPAIPVPRPTEQAQRSASLPEDLRERAAVLAPDRSAASRATVGSSGGPGRPSGSVGAPKGVSGRQTAAEDQCALDVLQLLVDGHTNRQIADQLDLTIDQVRYRVGIWLNASDARSRPGLITWARTTGVLNDGIPQ